MSSRHLGTGAREHLKQADKNTKSVIKDRLYDCDKCSFIRHSRNLSMFLKSQPPNMTQQFSKLQDALLLKKLNPKLNKQLYAYRASCFFSSFK